LLPLALNGCCVCPVRQSNSSVWFSIATLLTVVLTFGPSFASERFASQFFPAEAKPRMRFGKFFWTDSGAERGLGGIAVSYSRANWPI
jgi:hypothetical protein